jgi:hypothetical protein
MLARYQIDMKYIPQALFWRQREAHSGKAISHDKAALNLGLPSRELRGNEPITSQTENAVYLCEFFMSVASQAARLVGLELVEVASAPKSKRTRPRLPVPDHAAKKAVLMNLPRDLYMQLDELASHDGRSLTDVMCRATSDYLAMRMVPTKFL